MLQYIKSHFEHEENETQRKLNNTEMTEMMERYCRGGQRDERKEFVYLSLYPRKQGGERNKVSRRKEEKKTPTTNCTNPLLRDERQRGDGELHSLSSLLWQNYFTASRTVCVYMCEYVG